MYRTSLAIFNLHVQRPNRINPAEFWRHIDFWRWQPRPVNSTSDFVFRNFAQLGKSKSTCIPNCGDISHCTVEILLLQVSWNKHPPCWNSRANVGLSLVLKFRLEQIYTFGDIAVFMLWGLGLKLPIYVVVSAANGQNQEWIYFRGRNCPYTLLYTGRYVHSTSNFQRCSWSFWGCLLT